MKNNQERLQEESLEEYFFRMLVDKEVAFPKLLAVYVAFLERENKEQWGDVVEGSTLVLALHGTIKTARKRALLWAGSPESLKKRCIDFLNKHKLYGDVKE